MGSTGRSIPSLSTACLRSKATRYRADRARSRYVLRPSLADDPQARGNAASSELAAGIPGREDRPRVADGPTDIMPQIGSSSTSQDREPNLVGRSLKGLSVRPYTGAVTTRGTVPRLIKRDELDPVLRLALGATQKAVSATVIKGEGRPRRQSSAADLEPTARSPVRF